LNKQSPPVSTCDDVGRIAFFIFAALVDAASINLNIPEDPNPKIKYYSDTPHPGTGDVNPETRA